MPDRPVPNSAGSSPRDGALNEDFDDEPWLTIEDYVEDNQESRGEDSGSNAEATAGFEFALSDDLSDGDEPLDGAEDDELHDEEEALESHRGAFGEFGGESGGLIERTFREKIVLAALMRPMRDEEQTEQSLDELALLVDTAGADAVARVVQRRGSPDPATYLGKGKVEELRELCESVDADTVVFDDELTPAEQYNLEKVLGRTALDRTAVILDIFAQNAHSQEGKAQVELALLRYRLPRLRGKGKSLSQQVGAIGLRGGPGETQLELDRRSILRRVHKLEADLRSIAHHRATQRKARRRSRLKTVTIVGYTNAGKSTLLNCLTDAGVLVEDRLFATLDATTRRLELPGGEAVLFTDTVGFITKLPHGLVEAFKSTLELVADADLLVHVVDASAADPLGQIDAVHAVLGEISANSVPELLAFNKADLAPEEASRLAKSMPAAVAFSAATGDGVPELLAAIADQLRALTTTVELHVPFARGDVLAEIHREGEVLSQEPGQTGIVVLARLEDAAKDRLRQWVVDDSTDLDSDPACLPG